jgi:hypothetical protein
VIGICFILEISHYAPNFLKQVPFLQWRYFSHRRSSKSLHFQNLGIGLSFFSTDSDVWLWQRTFVVPTNLWSHHWTFCFLDKLQLFVSTNWWRASGWRFASCRSRSPRNLEWEILKPLGGLLHSYSDVYMKNVAYLEKELWLKTAEERHGVIASVTRDMFRWLWTEL